MVGLSVIRAAVALAVVGAGLAFLLPARAASDMQVTALDCVLHPRKIAIHNAGDAPQDLTGWKLLSNKPNEVFDLGVVGTVGPGVIFYVFNGHMAPRAPEKAGNEWIYPWNYTPVLDESAFVLTEDGTDFIRLIDASQWPWRQVSVKGCDTTGEIPPFELPATPTPPAPSSDQGTGGNTDQPGSNEAASAQTDGAQTTGASQNVSASGNTANSSAGTTAAQSGNASGQAVGGPASGIGVLSTASGPPFTGPLLPLGLLSGVAGAALMLIAVRMLSRALRRPQGSA